VAVQFADAVKLGDARNIDKHGGLDHAQIEHGQKRLSAGKNARVIAPLGE
jgi:hypothetical protein